MNLTLRHHVPTLARRTIQIAKTALGLEKQLLHTTGIAAGITDCVWRMEEFLLFRAPAWHQPIPKRMAA